MHQDVAIILFEFAALIFAFCIHEASHAWMASRLGDQTARMLGRVTLNPIKHLDPLGSVILPLISAFYHAPLIGWAKPTPVTPRNFKNYRRDDILVTIAGPLSNLLFAVVCLVLLIILNHTGAKVSVANAAGMVLGFSEATMVGSSIAFPIILLLYASLLVNLSLFAFNLIPIPPLDGARVLTHFLSPRLQEIYNKVGMFSLLILMLAGGRLMGIIFVPMLLFFNRILFSI